MLVFLSTKEGSCDYIFWANYLRKAQLPHRGINQCWHTFASRLLTTGKYPEKWIANYLGHTTTAMLHKHYGEFIEADLCDLEKRASADLSLLPTKPASDVVKLDRGNENLDFNPMVAQKYKIKEQLFKFTKLDRGEGRAWLSVFSPSLTL